MKAYCGVDVYVHVFLTSALDGGEWSDSHPSRSIIGERAPSTHWVGCWVDIRTGLDAVEKRRENLLPLPGIERCRPARNPSLYRLNYPGSGL
jgi:hypothetical protein